MPTVAGMRRSSEFALKRWSLLGYLRPWAWVPGRKPLHPIAVLGIALYYSAGVQVSGGALEWGDFRQVLRALVHSAILTFFSYAWEAGIKGRH